MAKLGHVFHNFILDKLVLKCYNPAQKKPVCVCRERCDNLEKNKEKGKIDEPQENDGATPRRRIGGNTPTAYRNTTTDSKTNTKSRDKSQYLYWCDCRPTLLPLHRPL